MKTESCGVFICRIGTAADRRTAISHSTFPDRPYVSTSQRRRVFAIRSGLRSDSRAIVRLVVFFEIEVTVAVMDVVLLRIG